MGNSEIDNVSPRKEKRCLILLTLGSVMDIDVSNLDPLLTLQL